MGKRVTWARDAPIWHCDRCGRWERTVWLVGEELLCAVCWQKERPAHVCQRARQLQQIARELREAAAAQRSSRGAATSQAMKGAEEKDGEREMPKRKATSRRCQAIVWARMKGGVLKRVWIACAPLHCCECGAPIPEGAGFTRGLANRPICQGCDPVMVEGDRLVIA